MEKCIKCEAPNPEGWFYCRTCGEKTIMNEYSTNLWMRTERGARTDVEFSSVSMDSHIDGLVKERENKASKFWTDATNKALN